MNSSKLWSHVLISKYALPNDMAIIDVPTKMVLIYGVQWVRFRKISRRVCDRVLETAKG